MYKRQNIFSGQLEVPEHISDIIFAFQALFDSPQHEKVMETAKIAVFRPFGAYKGVVGLSATFGAIFQSCSKCLHMSCGVQICFSYTQRMYLKDPNTSDDNLEHLEQL